MSINDDVETPTSGWFVSVYDPEKDLENLEQYSKKYYKGWQDWQKGKGKRAIVVFFEFIEPLSEIVKDMINAKKDLILEPQNWDAEIIDFFP